MSEADKLPPTMLKFSGTPAEVGVQIWTRMCNPAVRAASAMTANELVQLYAGLISAALLVTACNTIHGAGKDVSSAGNAVANAADNAK